MSELQEAKLRQDLFVMLERNRGELNKIDRMMRRFLKCLRGFLFQLDLDHIPCTILIGSFQASACH